MAIDAPREGRPKSRINWLLRQLGQKRGKAEGSFVRETRAQTFDFYREIVQQMKAWQARPPRLRGADGEEVPVGPSPEPPRFEQSDTREIGEAADPVASAGAE